MKYESSILKRLIDVYGVVGNPRYISEIIKQFIVQGKECYPNLFTYQSDWLAHIDEFGLTPEYTVSYTGQQIYAPNTKEKPVKRAILSGNTLVNLFEEVERQPEVDKAYRFFKVIGNQVPTLKPNTKYTLIFDKYVEGVSTIIYKTHATSLMTEDYTFGKSFCFTTIEEVGTEFHIFIKGKTVEIAEQMLKLNPKIVILEGDYTNVDIPYFEGMQSVKLPVLTTTGKNIVGNLEPGYINNITGENVDGANSSIFSRTGFIFLKKDTTYSFSTNGAKRSFHLYLYDLNKNFETRIGLKNEYTPEADCYIRLYQQDNINAALYQVEEGLVATSYEPFKTNILSASEDVTLRGIGDVRDTLDCLTGEVVERIGEVIFDGSVDENWNLWATYPEESAIFKLSKENSLKLMKEFDKNGVFKCDKFSTVLKTSLINIGDTYPHAISFFGLDGEYIQLRVYKSLLKSIDVAGLREYLTNEPITVQYQLATESVKTVDLSVKDQDNQMINQLSTFEGGTHFTSSSQGGSLLPMISVDVATDLEETLKVCSLEGNTL